MGFGNRTGPAGCSCFFFARHLSSAIFRVPCCGARFRLNPRGPGYTDNGMGKRDEPGDEPIECVGAFDGDYNAHTKWTRVAVPTKALSVRQPSGSDHPIVMLEGKGEQEVSVSADGTVRLRTPAAEVPGGWRTLPGVLPCCKIKPLCLCCWLLPRGWRSTKPIAPGYRCSCVVLMSSPCLPYSEPRHCRSGSRRNGVRLWGRHLVPRLPSSSAHVGRDLAL